METHEFDFRGLRCPLPVLKARKALKSLTPGTQARILVDDPKAPQDFADFAQLTGHSLDASDPQALLLTVRG